nr:aldehyde dehydrogenase family protein [Luteimonas sp. BDR2-5]
MIKKARSSGAKVVDAMPPSASGLRHPRTLMPMLVVGLDDDAALMQEEIFGPILPVRTCRDIDEVIAYVNARPHPLALYYFGAEDDDCARLLVRTTSGNSAASAPAAWGVSWRRRIPRDEPCQGRLRAGPLETFQHDACSIRPTCRHRHRIDPWQTAAPAASKADDIAMMKIGELAKRTGLAPSRIRFYERIGLLKTVQRQANGYRSYPDDAVLVLQLITTGQKAGFSLDELATLLPTDMASWEHETLVGTLQRKVQEIEALQERLARSKAQLVELLDQIEAKPADMDCAANAKRVLSELQLGMDEADMPTPGPTRDKE